MAEFVPEYDRPCPLTRFEAVTDEHPLHAQWQAGIDARRAATQGPPSPVLLHNRAQMATLERHFLGRVVTPELR